MSGDFAGDLGLIPGQGTRSHMLQLGVYMPQLGPGAPNTLKKNIYIYICVCVCVCVCVCMCLENDLTKGENLFYISIPIFVFVSISSICMYIYQKRKIGLLRNF